MLQTIRDHSKGFLALALMGLIFFSFVIWGIDFQFGRAAAPVQVNGEPLPVNQVYRVYQNQLSRYQQAYPNGIPDMVLEQLKRDVLNGAAQEEVLYRHALDRGFRVSDQTLADFLSKQPQLQVGGQFSFDQFNLEAQRQGYSAEGFEEVIRRSLVTQQLRNAVQATAFMTPEERARRGALEQETRTVRYVRIPVSNYLNDVVPDESAIEAEYRQNMDRYVTTESVKLQYIELSPQEMAADVEVPEEELRALYAAGVEAGQYSQEETRKSRHILIAVDQDADAQADAAARAEAEALLARIEAGEDFAELAREHSDDPGSKVNGGDLGFAPKAAFVGPFSDALFSMQVGEVRGPVKTTFGYHLIRLDEISADQTRPYDEVRDEIKEEERLRVATTLVDELSQELDEAVYDNDDNLEVAADLTGLPLRETGWITRSSGGGIGADANVREVAFSDPVFLDRRNSEAIRYNDGYLYIRIADHQPARQRTLDEVRPEITAQLTRRFAGDRARKVGEELQAKLADGATLEDAAAELGLEVQTAEDAPRRGPALPPALATAAFSAPAPAEGTVSTGGASLAGGDYAVFQVEAVQSGEAMDEAMANQFASLTGSYEFRAFIDALVEDADVVIRPDALQ